MNGDKKLCGADKDPPFSSNKYLYLTEFNPGDVFNLFDSGVCVDKCPTSSSDNIDSCEDTASVKNCKTLKVRKTYALLNYCIPDFTDGTSWTPEVKANWKRAWT